MQEVEPKDGKLPARWTLTPVCAASLTCPVVVWVSVVPPAPADGRTPQAAAPQEGLVLVQVARAGVGRHAKDTYATSIIPVLCAVAQVRSLCTPLSCLAENFL